jgi:nicotinate-nucleotide adenylyltransferase
MTIHTKKKIGLLGGTFDPIHTGHLIVAELIRDEVGLEKIFIVPAKKHPFKDNNFIASEEHRLKMIHMAIDDNDHLEVSDVEMKADQISYTVDTIRKFEEEYENEGWDIHFLMGMDNLNQLYKWKNPNKLLKLCKILVFSRPGFKPAPEAHEFLPFIRIIPVPLLEISSTQIRDRVSKGHTIRYLVPPQIESYIIEHKLYASVSG